MKKASRPEKTPISRTNLAKTHESSGEMADFPDD